MEMTKEQIESLAGFALEILEDWPDLGSIEPWDLQDIAEKYKLLIPRTVFAPCGEDCNCAGSYLIEEMQKGVTCYHIADWLVRDAELHVHPTEAGGACREKHDEWAALWNYCPGCGARVAPRLGG